MPSNSITIVSPVTGETVPASDPLGVTIDYSYHYTASAWVGGRCSAPLTSGGYFHVDIEGPIGSGTNSSVEAGLGKHSAGYTSVQIEARILSTSMWGSYYNSTTISDITISTNPPFRFDPPPGPPPPPTFYRLAQAGVLNSDKTDAWARDGLEKYDPKKHAPMLERDYDPTVDLKLTGTITDPAHFNGSISAIVNGRVGATGLALVYTVPVGNITIDTTTGKWEVKIPSAVLGGSPVPRQAILSLFTAGTNFVATISTALKKI